MAEFDDKLNSLLSNPEAMDQIMKMAQSLMGTSGESPETGGSPRNAAGAVSYTHLTLPTTNTV